MTATDAVRGREPKGGVEYRRYLAEHGDAPAHHSHPPERATEQEADDNRHAKAQPQSPPTAQARRERYVNHIIYSAFLGICLTEENLRHRQPINTHTDEGMMGAHQYYADWLTLWCESATGVAKAIEEEDAETIRELTGNKSSTYFRDFASALEEESWRQFMAEGAKSA